MSLTPGSSAPILGAQANSELALARLAYAAGPPVRPDPLPASGSLPASPLPGRIDLRNALRVDIPLNAAAPAAPRPLFSVKRGRTVTLALANSAEMPCVVHVHGHSSRLLDALDDGWKPFWLDTIMASGQRTTRIAFVADNPGKWLLEHRMLGRPDIGVAWFDVV